MHLTKTNLKNFLKKHMKPEKIENTFFNRSREDKMVDKYYKDLLIYKYAFIPASEAQKDMDIKFDDKLNIVYDGEK